MIPRDLERRQREMEISGRMETIQKIRNVMVGYDIQKSPAYYSERPSLKMA